MLVGTIRQNANVFGLIAISIFIGGVASYNPIIPLVLVFVVLLVLVTIKVSPAFLNHLSTVLLFIFVLGLPLHTLMMKIAEFGFGLDSTLTLILSMWKDFLLLILLVIAIFHKSEQKKWYKISFASLEIFIILFLGICFIYIFVSPSLLNGFYGFRGTVEPLMVYFLFRLWPLGTKRRGQLINAMLILGSAIAILAIIQVNFIGRDVYQNFGYALINGELSSTFNVLGSNWVRPPATFSNANSAGFYFAILIVLATRYFQVSESLRVRQRLIIALSCLGLGLIFTISRSAWIVALWGVLCLAVFAPTIRQRRRLKRWIVAGSVILIVFLSFPNSITDGVVNKINLTVSGTDPSASGRIPDIERVLMNINDHPFGVGLGIVGARASRYNDQFMGLFHTENYFLQIFLETGIFGGILLMGIYISAVILLWNARRFQMQDEMLVAPLTVFGILTGIIIASNFLPILNDLPMASYLWMLVGMVANTFRVSRGNLDKGFRI